MNPGKLRHKINIQQELVTQNSFGEPTQAWVNFLSGIYCSIEPIRGKEYFSADMVNAEVTTRIRMRYFAGIKSKMRIKFENRYYDIIDVIDILESHKELQLMCKEVIS
jgi:SPP1 family predicted phage head-tail adaptor